MTSVLEGSSLDAALPRQLERCPAADQSLLREFATGTLRFHIRYRALLRSLVQRPLRGRDQPVEALLAVGIYQLEQLRIPDHAAVSATVDACALLGRAWAAQLVNAVLRRYRREAAALEASLSPSERAACPGWLYKRLAKQWPDALGTILEASNVRPPMVLRVNGSRTTRRAYLARLEAAGIEASPGALGADAVYLASARDTATIPGFADGLVSVQDEAAQVAADLLPLAPGLRVLDACAAPGGKSCHLLEREPSIDLLASDIDERRLGRVRANLARLGLDAHVLHLDGTDGAALEGERFDRILVDAPCSGTGVLRRHPDIKALRRPDDLPALAARQLALLEALLPKLRPGGYLLYATCSVLRAENQEVVRETLRRHRGIALRQLAVPGAVNDDAGSQLLPSAAGHDGLFYGLLQQVAP